MHVIKKIRIALGGLTYQELATQLAVTPRTVYYWEKGKSRKPSLKHVAALWKLIENHKARITLNLDYETFCEELLNYNENNCE